MPAAVAAQTVTSSGASGAATLQVKTPQVPRTDLFAEADAQLPPTAVGSSPTTGDARASGLLQAVRAEAVRQGQTAAPAGTSTTKKKGITKGGIIAIGAGIGGGLGFAAGVHEETQAGSDIPGVANWHAPGRRIGAWIGAPRYRGDRSQPSGGARLVRLRERAQPLPGQRTLLRGLDVIHLASSLRHSRAPLEAIFCEKVPDTNLTEPISRAYRNRDTLRRHGIRDRLPASHPMVAIFTVVAVASAAALGLLSWQLLDQDRQLEIPRRRGVLEAVADEAIGR